MTGVAYGRIKSVRDAPEAKALVKRVLACLDTSSSQVGLQAGETVGVLLAQMKRAGDAGAESADESSPSGLSVPSLERVARDVLRDVMNDPNKISRYVCRGMRDYMDLRGMLPAFDRASAYHCKDLG